MCGYNIDWVHWSAKTQLLECVMQIDHTSMINMIQSTVVMRWFNLWSLLRMNANSGWMLIKLDWTQNTFAKKITSLNKQMSRWMQFKIFMQSDCQSQSFVFLDLFENFLSFYNLSIFDYIMQLHIDKEKMFTNFKNHINFVKFTEILLLARFGWKKQNKNLDNQKIHYRIAKCSK